MPSPEGSSATSRAFARVRAPRARRRSKRRRAASQRGRPAEISEVVSTELRFRCTVELLPKGSLKAFQTNKNQKQQLFEHRYDT